MDDFVVHADHGVARYQERRNAAAMKDAAA
jgi:hypothetical protein